MTLFLAIAIVLLARSLNKSVVISGHKQYDKKEREIADRYRCDGFKNIGMLEMITPYNPRYVEYIKEINAFRESYGKAPLMSVEKAESERKRYLEIFKNKVDEEGYILNSFGKRQN